MQLNEKKILVVDDSPIIRKIIKRELSEGGYIVEEADDGKTALAQFVECMPDLVTLDIEMPTLDGFETFKKMRSKQSPGNFKHSKEYRVPVIFITGNDNLKDRIKGFQLGAADFITKPFVKGDVLSIVNKILKPENRLLKLTALVVDDSPTSRSIVSSTLEREGVIVIEAGDGFEAYQILCARKAEIDMVISDLDMPHLDGNTLCKKIRNELLLPDLPFILLTGLNDQSKLLEIFKSGVTDYLSKPFVREELLARLTAHLERTHLNKHLRKTIAELEKTKIKTEKANKAKNEFLANVSHEFKTPLNAIIGLTDLALKNELTPKLEGYLKKISDSSQSLLLIINDILDFSEIEAGKLDLETVEFQLDDVISNLTNLIEDESAKKSIAFIVEVKPNVPHTLIGDHLRLGQVLINLANNAVKFTERGKIILQVALFNENKDGVTINFSVKDTGIGLDPLKVPTLFDAFTQADGATSRKYGGTGIGLAICKRLVEMMGGQIWIESQPGKGSTFYFTAHFKTCKNKQDSSIKPPAGLIEMKTPAADILNKEVLQETADTHILLAEDNLINQQIVLEMLENAGWRVTIAKNGNEALKALEVLMFDAVLMDIQMPEMDGYEAVRLIRKDKRFKNLPVIAMTAHDRKGDKEKCLKAGMDEYLAKPIDQDQLLSTLTKWIAPGKERASLFIPPVKTEEREEEYLPESINGINIDAGLKRMGGSRKLYRKILLQFAAEFKDASERMRDIIRRGDIEEGERLTHNIKGVSGNISANDLLSATMKLESAFKQSDRGNFVSLLSNFDKSLHQVLTSIGKLKKTADMQIEIFAEPLLDIETLSPIFTRLQQLLQKNDLVEDELLESLQKNILGSKYENKMKTFEKYLDNFDYQNALSALSNMSEYMGIPFESFE
ncbi:MAG: response regulator [Proteobacteria bacterium]|nr:response regulator [Pseudomonadota bacterium]MBU4037711.1 response regulator [Pseudomonadota bacterium]